MRLSCAWCTWSEYTRVGLCGLDHTGCLQWWELDHSCYLWLASLCLSASTQGMQSDPITILLVGIRRYLSLSSIGIALQSIGYPKMTLIPSPLRTLDHGYQSTSSFSEPSTAFSKPQSRASQDQDLGLNSDFTFEWIWICKF